MLGYAVIQDSLLHDSSELASLDADGSMAMESGLRDSRFTLSRFETRFSRFCRLDGDGIGLRGIRDLLVLDSQLASLASAGWRRNQATAIRDSLLHYYISLRLLLPG